MSRDDYLYTDVRTVSYSCEWVITGYSFLDDRPGDSVDSSVFRVPGIPELNWYLRLYPGGVDPPHRDYVSLYVCCYKAGGCVGVAAGVDTKPSLLAADDGSRQPMAKVRLSARSPAMDVDDSGNGRYCNRRTTLLGRFDEPPAGGHRHHLHQQQQQQQRRGFDDFAHWRDAARLINSHDDRLVILCEIEARLGVSSVAASAILAPAPAPPPPPQRCSPIVTYALPNDLTLLVDGTLFRCHRAVLQAGSRKFREYLRDAPPPPSSLSPPTNDYCLALGDVPLELTPAMLDYLYNGRLDTVRGLPRTKEFLLVAEDYGFLDDAVRAHCDTEIERSVNAANAYQLFILADVFGLARSKARARLYLTDGEKARWRTIEMMESGGR